MDHEIAPSLFNIMRITIRYFPHYISFPRVTTAILTAIKFQKLKNYNVYASHGGNSAEEREPERQKRERAF